MTPRRAAVLAGLAILAAAGVVYGITTDGDPSCPKLAPDGGVLNGITYLETVHEAKPGDRLPMVILFHSRGGTPAGAGSFGGIGPVRVIRPNGFNRTNGGFTWFTKSSGSTKTANSLVPEMRMRATQLAAFITRLSRCRPTIGKPIVTGSSEGGHVSYILANQAPDAISGAVAVNAYIPEALWNRGMAPTVGLHNIGDAAIPFARTESFWATMAQAGADIHTQSFAGGHEISADELAAWRSAVSAFAARQRHGG